MVEKILNNTTPYGKSRASHEGTLHSSTLRNNAAIAENYELYSRFKLPYFLLRSVFYI